MKIMMTKMLLKPAWRNVFRYGFRNMILASLIMLTSGMMIYSLAFQHGVQNSMNRLLISSLTGHLQISSAEYPKNCLAIPEIKDKSFISSYERVIQTVSKLSSQIKACTPRLVFGAAIYREDLLQPVRISGIDPENEGKVNASYQVEQGRLLSADDERGILLSSELAAQLGARPGQELDLLTGNIYGDIAARTFKIQGILKKTGLDVFIGGYAMIPIQAARCLTAVENSAATLVLTLNDPGQLTTVKTGLQHELDSQGLPVVVNTWQDIRGIFDSMQRTVSFFSLLGTITLFLIIIVGIINSLLMSVFDRTREIGTLLALGTTRRQIFIMLLLEMILVALLAAGSGILLSCALIMRLAKSGLSGVNETVATLWGGGRLFPQIFCSDVCLVLATLLVVVIAATLYPAALATRKNPSQALRYI